MNDLCKDRLKYFAEKWPDSATYVKFMERPLGEFSRDELILVIRYLAEQERYRLAMEAEDDEAAYRQLVAASNAKRSRMGLPPHGV